jgi:hypothetical protein
MPIHRLNYELCSGQEKNEHGSLRPLPCPTYVAPFSSFCPYNKSELKERGGDLNRTKITFKSINWFCLLFRYFRFSL